jgi:D-amino-acid dehydrogenase
VLGRDEILKIEPALKSFASHIVGGTYTDSDESGDARVFTQKLAERCVARGAEFLYSHDVVSLNTSNNAIESIAVQAVNMPAAGQNYTGQKPINLTADAYVVACGSYTAPLLRTVGVDVPIYPGKGYSATFKILKPELAPHVSFIDDQAKCAMTRLGNQLRVAGTIEIGAYDSTIDSELSQIRCRMLAKRVETVLPGVCDTRTAEEGGSPNFWSGLRPATPTNIPIIGKTKVGKLWVNAGHGTLGWTHGAGSGKALAELIDGKMPEIGQGKQAGSGKLFEFYGF